MAMGPNSPFVIANNKIQQQGWVHYFVPRGVNMIERLSWLVDLYGVPIGEFDPMVLDDYKTWMLLRLEDNFKTAMDFPHDYMLLFENEQMLMMYKLRWPA